MNIYNFVFSRIESWQLDACMVVEIKSDKKTAKKALEAFEVGITAWVKKHEAGRECWLSSSKDLNIGDLADYENNPELKQELELAGITEWRCVTSLDVDNHVDYDRQLVDDTELAEEELDREN